jgi:Lipopolysaccharide-assembly
MENNFLIQRQGQRTSRRGAFAVIGIFAILICGCARYQFGLTNLYRSDIRTISVPIVRSDSLRPDIGVRLTEMLQKRIEERTPFKIVSDSAADSVLVCRLTSDTKQVVTETITDEPRVLKSVMTVDCSWTDRRGNVLMENRFLPPGEISLYFAQNANIIPEAGQSLATSQQQAMERLVDHIVDQLETRW